MVREITLEILTNSWFVEDRKLLDIAKDTDDNYFASLKTYQDKIVYAFDHLVLHIDEEMRSDKRFLEVCNFTYEDTKFTGTFIEALEFLKRNLEEMISKEDPSYNPSIRKKIN